MKKQVISFVVSSLIILGAGCTQQAKIAATQPTNEAFVERRVTQPPSAPEHIPAPTPVNMVEVIK